MSYESDINWYISEVKGFISTSLNSDSPIFKKEISKLPFLSGKFLRSSFLFSTLKLFNSNPSKTEIEKSIVFGSSIELLHLSTLVHDDVIDEADKRRGVDSLNTASTNRIAILVGDFIFSTSFKIMSDFSEGASEILQFISKACGDLVLGEVKEEILIENYNLKIDEYIDIIEKKTARLFSAALVSGAIISNCKKEYIDKIDQFGMSIGRAFQMIDDAIDYFVLEKDSGKKQFSDIKAKKMTLPMLKLRDLVNEEDGEVLMKIFEKNSIVSQENIDFVNDLMKKYNIFEKTIELARLEVEDAKKIILDFNDCEAKDYLISFCDKILL